MGSGVNVDDIPKAVEEAKQKQAEAEKLQAEAEKTKDAAKKAKELSDSKAADAAKKAKEADDLHKQAEQETDPIAQNIKRKQAEDAQQESNDLAKQAEAKNEEARSLNQQAQDKQKEADKTKKEAGEAKHKAELAKDQGSTPHTPVSTPGSLGSPGPFSSGGDDTPPVPPSDLNGTKLPDLPAPAGGLKYPQMGDAGDPGFEFVTAGNEYKWVGGDASRVTVGDKREIVGATSTTHVNSSRFTQIGGANISNYMAGNCSYTKGESKTIVDGGPQIREVHGNQENRIWGNRYVYSSGWRKEINIGARIEFWFGGRKEVGVGGKSELVGPFKFETILGVKHTTVLGAKIDHVKGAKIEVSNGPAKYESPNIVFAVLGAVTFCKSSKLVQRVGKVETKADKVTVDAETDIKKKTTIKDDVKMTRRAFITGKFSASGGDLKAG